MVPDPHLAAYGLPGLFVSTFLSGAVLPLPSDALVVGLIVLGQPVASTVVVATAGNTLGAITIYWMATRLAVGQGRLARWLQARIARSGAAREKVARWGAPALLLSWVPGIGDALVLAAGLAGVRLAPFLAFVVAGKVARYAVLAAAASAAA